MSLRHLRGAGWIIRTVAIVLGFSLAGLPAVNAQASLITEATIRSHMEFLAGDALQGRGSGTRDELLAATYIGSQLRRWGIEPLGDDGGYVQQVATSRAVPFTPPTLTVERLTFRTGPDIGVTVGTMPSSGPLYKYEEGKPVPAGSFVLLTESANPLTADTAGAAGVMAMPAPAAAGRGNRGNAGAAGAPAGAGRSAESGAGPARPAGPDPRAIVCGGTKAQEARQAFQQAQGGANANAGRAGGGPPAGGAGGGGGRPGGAGGGGRAGGGSTAQTPWRVTLSQKTYIAISTMANGTPVSVSADLRSFTYNAMGRLKGSDPSTADDIILLTAHLDHLGVRGVNENFIFNGADDDASGSTAVLALAEALAKAPRTKRTIVFAWFGSEESGGFGARHFLDQPPVPLEKIVANLEFEMLGRADPLVPDQSLWLTGFECSDLGKTMADHGAKLVMDPRPDQSFFNRSDNIQLAKRGIIAHTVSSFNLHTDYHRATDEVKTIDFVHMTRSIQSMYEPVRWLANGKFKPQWHEGMCPLPCGK